MADLSDADVMSLMAKYKGKIEEQLDTHLKKKENPVFSREYQIFRKEFISKRLSLYEKLCAKSEKILKIDPKPESKKKLQTLIDVSHMNITPAGAVSLSILAPIIFIVITMVLSLLLTDGFFFIVIGFLVGLMLMNILANVPTILANNWRMKSSNQMVLCIFYIVTYMRHTSNLENAVNFAGEHLNPPLSLDLKKVLWDVEIQRYESIKESLDIYLQTWREWNNEFVEAFHLIESSLFEPNEIRRVELLDKSLDVILEETYEKMLHYAHDLQGPVTTLHMLGVVMPILGLVVLPLVVSFMDNVRWYHLMVMYNILLPLSIYYLARKILSTRPTGYGDTDISENHPELGDTTKVSFKFGGTDFKVDPKVIAITVGVILLIIGFSPLWIHAINPDFDIGIGQEDLRSSCGNIYCFLEYKMSTATEGPTVGKIIGPFGIGATIIGILVPLAFSIGFGLYFKLRSRNTIKIRERSKRLEREFASALFQLGNRLGDGIPAELAIQNVADTMEGSVSAEFFRTVSINIKKLGMSVKEAIFNPKRGALIYFPSNVISSSMKVLIVSVTKGPKAAASALINVARYIKEIHRVDERLKDLMSDIISSMKSQISFLTPVVSGIVIGITSMITMILGKLGNLFPDSGDAGAIGAANISQMFGDGVPAYFFQIVVGVYVVQVIYILTVVINGIENGSDKLSERYSMGNNLIRSTLLYAFISIVVILIFNLVAGKVLLSTI